MENENQKIEHILQLLKKAQNLGLNFYIGNAYISRAYIDAQNILNAEIDKCINEMKNEITDIICDSDNPNVCPKDGIRTVLIDHKKNVALEYCPLCLRQYKFHNN
jgi:hypothetical protein